MLTLLEGVLLVCLISMIIYWYRSPPQQGNGEERTLKSGWQPWSDSIRNSKRHCASCL